MNNSIPNSVSGFDQCHADGMIHVLYFVASNCIVVVLLMVTVVKTIQNANVKQIHYSQAIVGTLSLLVRQLNVRMYIYFNCYIY